MAIVLPGNTFKIQRFLDESQGSLELMLCKSLGRFGPEICRQGPEESSFEIRSTLNPRKKYQLFERYERNIDIPWTKKMRRTKELS